MRNAELDVTISRDGTHRRASEIRTRIERPSRSPLWIGGIFVCLLAASAIAAVGRAIPASYESIPAELGRAPRGAENAHGDFQPAPLPVARDAASGRNRQRCPECGFVESIRAVEGSGKVGAATVREYEIAVRFRDGSTTVFNEATPGTWRLGSRIIVIAGSKAAND